LNKKDCKNYQSKVPTGLGQSLVWWISPITPGSEDHGFQNKQNPDSSIYTATHAAISVPMSEEKIWAIVVREGWRCVNRSGFFDVIEFWLENRILIELLPPAFVARYLDFMEPQTLKQFFVTGVSFNK
jgi:hypothetical protein